MGYLFSFRSIVAGQKGPSGRQARDRRGRGWGYYVHVCAAAYVDRSGRARHDAQPGRVEHVCDL